MARPTKRAHKEWQELVRNAQQAVALWARTVEREAATLEKTRKSHADACARLNALLTAEPPLPAARVAK